MTELAKLTLLAFMLLWFLFGMPLFLVHDKDPELFWMRIDDFKQWIRDKL